MMISSPSEEKLRDYLDGRLSEKEELEMQLWLAENSKSPAVEEKVSEYFNNMPLDVDPSTGKSFKSVAKRLNIRTSAFGKDDKSRIILRWVARAAAMLAIPISIAIGYYIKPGETQWIEKNVPEGKTESLILSDGTSLILNSGSRVTYPSEFNGKERAIFMEGEVLADVAHNSKKPFIIESNDVRVIVHGTRFDMKSYSNSRCVEILLLEGSITLDVDRNGSMRKFDMLPGNMAHYDRTTGDISVTDFNPESFWPFSEDRSIHFFDLTLKDISMDLERLFGVEIVINDESLANTKYFAYFTNNESLDDILNSLNSDGKMSISHKNRIIYIDSSNK